MLSNSTNTFHIGISMKTWARLKPGQNGTKKIVEKYGDALVCVRYRYDSE